MVDGTASAVARPAAAGRDSNAKGRHERWCSEQCLLPRLMARADVSWQRRGSESGNRDHVEGVWSRRRAPHVLAHERNDAEPHVMALVVAGHARRRRSVRVLAPGGGGPLGITPDLAQGGVLPHCQRQHDRKSCCSKHVKPCSPPGQEGLQPMTPPLGLRTGGSCTAIRCHRPRPWAEFPPRASKIPQRSSQFAGPRPFGMTPYGRRKYDELRPAVSSANRQVRARRVISKVAVPAVDLRSRRSCDRSRAAVHHPAPDGRGVRLTTRSGGEIIGSAALEIYPDGALLRSVAVAAERQGKGVGQELTAAGIGLAEDLGVARLYLLTTTADKFSRNSALSLSNALTSLQAF